MAVPTPGLGRPFHKGLQDQGIEVGSRGRSKKIGTARRQTASIVACNKGSAGPGGSWISSAFETLPLTRPEGWILDHLYRHPHKPEYRKRP